jgi:hypothetical protein
MKFRIIWFRKAHRYLGLSIGVQLLFWTISGFFFAWNSIDEVHGDPFVAHQHPAFALDTLHVVPVSTAIAALQQNVPTVRRVKAVSLREVMREPMYELEYEMQQGKDIEDHATTHFALVHAMRGEFRPPLTAKDAQAVAEADFAPEAQVVSVERVDSVTPSSEYREKPLPAYRITFDHESGTHLYVSAERGIVTARRNAQWRVWDFLWMFHILDFQTRDNIHNWVLRGFSAFGVITVLSGFLLWGMTTPLLRRKRGAHKLSHTTQAKQ